MDNGIKQGLLNKYGRLAAKLGVNVSSKREGANIIIKSLLKDFTDSCNNPAIWCMGEHTQMMMADFMYELKKVKFIIDDQAKDSDMGFKVISEGDVAENKIDGIIISSYDLKEEIKNTIKEKYPHIKYLDIYEKMEEKGIVFEADYYSQDHPYSRYTILNQLQNELDREEDLEKQIILFREIIKKYIVIKDFKSAIKYAGELADISNDPEDRTCLVTLKEIYDDQKKMMASVSDKNVVMFLFDGLMRKSVLDGEMPQLQKWINEETYFFTNAYSTSTSTYESLIPTYSENNDLRTQYYKKSIVPEGKCRFINEAQRQKRNIFFYTDSAGYIECSDIVICERFETATEKMWDFMMDASETDNGLFYIHILYESHFSYPNPYTKGKIIAEGTSIMFDFHENRGGRLRTDYIAQKKDSLKYLDDVVTPLLKLINCRMVIYADHGNMLLPKSQTPEMVGELKLKFHEDLLQIPIAVKSPEVAKGVKDNKLISLMELPQIISNLLENKSFDYEEKSHIKAQRSQIYNLDFIRLYRKFGYERALQAFEVFIFPDKHKLAVYADGRKELYLEDTKLNEKALCNNYYRHIKNEITVISLRSFIYSRIFLSHLYNQFLRNAFNIAKKLKKLIWG